MAEQQPEEESKHDAEKRHHASPTESSQGAFEQVHATSDVFSADGVREAKMPLAAGSESRSRRTKHAVFEDLEGQGFAGHARHLDPWKDVD